MVLKIEQIILRNYILFRKIADMVKVNKKPLFEEMLNKITDCKLTAGYHPVIYEDGNNYLRVNFKNGKVEIEYCFSYTVDEDFHIEDSLSIPFRDFTPCDPNTDTDTGDNTNDDTEDDEDDEDEDDADEKTTENSTGKENLSEHESLTTEQERLLEEEKRLVTERERLVTERERLVVAERERLVVEEQERLVTERERIVVVERKRLLEKRESLLTEWESLLTEREMSLE